MPYMFFLTFCYNISHQLCRAFMFSLISSLPGLCSSLAHPWLPHSKLKFCWHSQLHFPVSIFQPTHMCTMCFPPWHSCCSLFQRCHGSEGASVKSAHILFVKFFGSFWSSVPFLTQGGKDKASRFTVAQKELRRIFQELMGRLLKFQTFFALANSSVAHWLLLHFKKMDLDLVLWNSILFLSVAFPGDADDDKIVGGYNCPQNSVSYWCPLMLRITYVVVHSSTISGSCQLLTARNPKYGFGCLCGF